MGVLLRRTYKYSLIFKLFSSRYFYVLSLLFLTFFYLSIASILLLSPKLMEKCCVELVNSIEKHKKVLIKLTLKYYDWRVLSPHFN